MKKNTTKTKKTKKPRAGVDHKSQAELKKLGQIRYMIVLDMEAANNLLVERANLNVYSRPGDRTLFIELLDRLGKHPDRLEILKRIWNYPMESSK